MPRTFPPAWIRLAGSAANIKANVPNHWRCFVGREGPVIPLHSWSLIGGAHAQNVIPGSAPTGDSLGLSAWIDFYGRLTVGDDNVATIELMDPV